MDSQKPTKAKHYNIPDDVASTAEPDYLDELYSTLLESDEFVQTPIRIDMLPPDERGKAFVDQFLGAQPSSYPLDLVVPYKKARIMDHWMTKIGGRALVN